MSTLRDKKEMHQEFLEVLCFLLARNHLGVWGHMA